VKLLLILGLAPALWAVNPASLPECVAGAKTVFLRNDTKDYKTFDYLRDKLGGMDRWAFATKPQYADVLLLFTIESQTLGTMTSKQGGAVAIAGGVYGSSSTVHTAYVHTESLLRVQDLAGKHVTQCDWSPQPAFSRLPVSRREWSTDAGFNPPEPGFRAPSL
jgi:hypothetical protein